MGTRKEGLGEVGGGASLCRYATDPVVNFTIMALINIGGLGFAVWGDIRHHRRFSRLSVYSRLVVIITTVLIFGGAGVFAALEWNNPNTIGDLTVPQKLMAALFQSVTLRTAGFATFDQNALSDVSKAASDLLMLDGRRCQDRNGRCDPAVRVVDRARQDERACHEAPDPAAGS